VLELRFAIHTVRRGYNHHGAATIAKGTWSWSPDVVYGVAPWTGISETGAGPPGSLPASPASLTNQISKQTESIIYEILKKKI
jgi:hypothetical protein